MDRTKFGKWFRVMLVLVALICLAVAFQPAAAQEVQPPQQEGQVFSMPEITAWAKDVGARGAWLGVAILFDLALGVIAALRSKQFQWARIADFLSTYGAKAVGWLALEVLTLMPIDLRGLAGFTDGLALGAYALLLLSAVGSVLGHVSALGLLPVAVPGVAKPQG